MTRNEAIIAICDGKIVVDRAERCWRLVNGTFKYASLYDVFEWYDISKAPEEDEAPFTLYEEG